MINAFWCLSDNFGDRLTKYLIEKLSNDKCIYNEPTTPVDKYLVTGSILNWECTNGIIWGAGVANINDTIPLHKKVIATRGVYSNFLAKKFGNTTSDILGDPAILLPIIFNPDIEKKYELGIIPHYIDSYSFWSKFNNKIPKGALVIDVQQENLEDIIRNIMSCKRIISSSLHGLIVADAYEIPSQWVKLSDKILGDDVKYHDYYSSLGIFNESSIDLSNASSIDEVLDIKCSLKHIPADVIDKLYNSCPFK